MKLNTLTRNRMATTYHEYGLARGVVANITSDPMSRFDAGSPSGGNATVACRLRSPAGRRPRSNCRTAHRFYRRHRR